MEEKTKEMNANMPSDNELDANMPSDNELDANMLNETELGDVGGGKTEPRNLLYQGPKYPKTPDITRTCQPKAGNLLYKDEKHKSQNKLHNIEELHSFEGITLSDGDVQEPY